MPRAPLLTALAHARPPVLARIAALSVFGAALVGARVAATGSRAYLFLIWNLALAWIPLGLARGLASLARRPAHPAWSVALGVAWLLFLPNAPYLFTDLVHLRHSRGAPQWFDAVMFMTFAWTGLLLGVEALSSVARLVAERAGALASRAFVIASALLSGYGIYLGRFERLNSWDLATHPRAALREAVSPLAEPRAWIVSATVACLFLLVYLSLSPRPSAAGERASGA